MSGVAAGCGAENDRLLLIDSTRVVSCAVAVRSLVLLLRRALVVGETVLLALQLSSGVIQTQLEQGASLARVAVDEAHWVCSAVQA